MKKTMFAIGFMMVFAFVSGETIFADVAENDAKPELEKTEDSDVRALQTAYALADYGYENKSASALIEAADIIYKISTQRLKAEKKGDAEGAAEDVNEKYTVDKLLSEGKKFAGKDKSLIAWADSVAKAAKKAASGTRGAVGGPKIDYDSASPNGGTVRYTIAFYGNSFAEIAVNSLNGCDYDLYVYDQNGNAIVSDSSYSSCAYVSFCPRWTGPFFVVVKNRSRYSGAYQLLTN